MNKNSKLITSLIICIILLTVGDISNAKEFDKNNYEIEKKYLLTYFHNNGFDVKQINHPIELYNIEHELEAVCFTLDNKGYVILNIKDLSIPEFSIESNNPFKYGYQNIYNGPLKYYLIDKRDNLLEAKTMSRINQNEISMRYKKNKINDVTRANIIKNTINTNDIISKSDTGFGSITYTLPAWESNYYCGVDACSIVLKYYDLYFDSSFLSTSVQDTASETGDYLVNNYYIPDKGTFASELVSGCEYKGINYTGLSDYINDKDLTDYNVCSDEYSLLIIKLKINEGYPVITGTENHPSQDFTEHWVITSGYYIDIDESSYLVVNNGFGDNSVFITTDAQYYDNIVYIEK